MKKLILLLCCIPFLAGCATARAVRYPNVYYSPTDPNTIGIYYNFPPEPYEVIGEVAGSGAPAAGWEAVGKFMRQEAAKIGGHAIVIQRAGNVYAGTYVNPGSVTAQSMGMGFGSTYYGTTTYTTSPGYAIPMYAKEAIGVVIRFKNNMNTTVRSDRQIANCPQGHRVDVTGSPLGTDIKCPICNEVFQYGNSNYDSKSPDEKLKETRVIKCPQGHLFLYKEGIDEIQCDYCKKNYKIEECSITTMEKNVQ